MSVSRGNIHCESHQNDQFEKDHCMKKPDFFFGTNSEKGFCPASNAKNQKIAYLPYSCTCCPPPPPKKLGGTRLEIFNAPKNFCDFRPEHEKTRLKLPHFLSGERGQRVHEYGRDKKKFSGLNL